MTKQKRLGEMLIDAGMITQRQLEGALDRQKSRGGRLGTNLVHIGAIKDMDLKRFLASKTGIKEVSLSKVRILPNIIKKVPLKVAEKYHLIPIGMKDKHTIIVACVDPTDLNALDQVSFITNLKVLPVLATFSDIQQALNEYYRDGLDETGDSMTGSFDLSEVSEVVKQAEMERLGGKSAAADPDLIIFGDQTAELPRHTTQEPLVDKTPTILQPEPLPPPQSEPIPVPSVLDPQFSGGSVEDLEPDLDEDEDAEDFPLIRPIPPEPQPVQPGVSTFVAPHPSIRMPEDQEDGSGFTLDFGPPKEPKPRIATPIAPPTVEEKLKGLYHVLLKKGLITEAEVKTEVRRIMAQRKDEP